VGVAVRVAGGSSVRRSEARLWRALWLLVLAGFLLAAAGCGGSNSASNRTSSTTISVTTSTSSGSPAERLIAKTRSGVIRIETTACGEEAIGTGFLLSPTLVATVEHVVDGAVRITLSRNGKTLGYGTVIGEDPTRDLALVRTSKPITGYRFTFADRAPQLGEDVLALGFPLGLPLTVTKGSVSGLGRTIPIDNVRRRQLVQTDAAVNPGNSGGPLLATDTGDVVGLVDLGTTQANGISFAVSAAVASPLLDAWKVAPQPVAFAYCGDLALSGGSPGPTSTSGSSLPGYVRSVARVLENSAAVRKLLVSAIADANTDPNAARQTVELVVAARRDELASALSTAAPAEAAAAQQAFVRAFRLSLASDLLYQQWLNNGSAAVLSQAQANDTVTVSAKARFLSLYNQVRTSAGFAPIPTAFPF
jgi:hypothetical protein